MSPATSHGADAPLMLSVSGARGIVGRSMTPGLAVDYAAAFGSFIRAATGQAAPAICLGRDSRPSGEMLAAATLAGLASVGCKVIDLGVVATPSVAVMIARHKAAGGLVVTASHNPIEWNGLKCLNAEGLAPPPADFEKILARFQARSFEFVDGENAQPSAVDRTGHKRHVAKVLAAIDPEPIRAARLVVVLDSVNGAGCAGGKMLLEQLGCEIVHLNGEPTGRFAHRPEPTEANLSQLAGQTPAEGGHVGFAQDPDADRLAIVDETGRYIGEEFTLALAALRVLQMKGPGVLAANLSTSRMIDDIAAEFPGSTVLRTPVGEANVVAALKPAGGILGGEGNGGVIFPPVCWVRDSLSAMALVLSLLAESRSRLSAVVDDLSHYAMIKHAIDLKRLGGREGVQKAIDKVLKKFAKERLTTTDGVRIDLADGWVHIRPSNTEPILRLIAEAQTPERAWEYIDEVAVAAGLK